MPGRPIRSGAISFGLVTVPCRLEAAAESHSLSFRRIRLEDGGRLRYRKVCELAGQELTEAEIGKGYEFSKDEIIPITDQDLAEIPPPTVKAIGTAAFMPWDGIDLRHIGESAYLISADDPAESRGQEERTPTRKAASPKKTAPKKETSGAGSPPERRGEASWLRSRPSTTSHRPANGLRPRG
ncbi:Ku protein [Streptomyces sp. NBC_01361]|uniref:Ku protein n=1 Tax=Streptomyces sp. NBC_01361 TaxID=2903838 RepID=UPI002E32D55F|nr:Ku protein [Streptomyces sp. NBC_01361]